MVYHTSKINTLPAEAHGSENACTDLRDCEEITYNEIQYNRINDQYIQCALQYNHKRRTDYNPRTAILYIPNSIDITFRTCHTPYTSRHVANIVNYLLDLRRGRTLFSIKTILQTDLSITRKDPSYHQYH
jgi:hypothetical protein